MSTAKNSKLGVQATIIPSKKICRALIIGAPYQGIRPVIAPHG